MDDPYLIWSHEHGAWWAPGRHRYTGSVSKAGRYSQAEALHICAKAIPGTARRMGALPELPVREADVQAFTGGYLAVFAQLDDEPWE